MTASLDAPAAADTPRGGSVHEIGDIELQVRAAQAALVFGRARASNLLVPIVGLLVCWLWWESIDHGFGLIGTLLLP